MTSRRPPARGRGTKAGPPRGRGQRGSTPIRRDVAARARALGGEQVEGRQSVRELLLAGTRRTREVVLASDLDPAPIIDDIIDLADENKVRIREVGRNKFESMARTDAPQGVMAFAAPLREHELDELVSRDAEGQQAVLAAGRRRHRSGQPRCVAAHRRVRGRHRRRAPSSPRRARDADGDQIGCRRDRASAHGDRARHGRCAHGAVQARRVDRGSRRRGLDIAVRSHARQRGGRARVGCRRRRLVASSCVNAATCWSRSRCGAGSTRSTCRLRARWPASRSRAARVSGHGWQLVVDWRALAAAERELLIGDLWCHPIDGIEERDDVVVAGFATEVAARAAASAIALPSHDRRSARRRVPRRVAPFRPTVAGREVVRASLVGRCGAAARLYRDRDRPTARVRQRCARVDSTDAGADATAGPTSQVRCSTSVAAVVCCRSRRPHWERRESMPSISKPTR